MERMMGSFLSGIGSSSEVADSDYQVRLPRPALLLRFLSPEDVIFTARLRSPSILRLVLRERQRLAFEWLRIMRREAGRLCRLHVQAMRQAGDLRPRAEARLLAQVCLFWIVYELMCVMVLLYGPFRTQAFLRSVQGLGKLLSRLSGRIADRAAPQMAPLAGSARSD